MLSPHTSFLVSLAFYVIFGGWVLLDTCRKARKSLWVFMLVHWLVFLFILGTDAVRDYEREHYDALSHVLLFGSLVVFGAYAYTNGFFRPKKTQ
jgi:hypothetical protein